MHPDDFYGNSNNKSNSKELPSSIDTLDDAIAYLQKARQTMGGDVKFRIVAADEESYVEEYREVNNVILTGQQSLMGRMNGSSNGEYVLFVY